jgi:hypothetical protein
MLEVLSGEEKVVIEEAGWTARENLTNIRDSDASPCNFFYGVWTLV